ncbi:hypothetical protein RS030_111896 [Cryptosporidium xiaoi]|uniref:Uncharacterized protein n=1 Tax=Cryptosporidium xiaoi TaxID=659607 RepID=A0AAV9Y3P1_9CRYT|nr:hypothetical protein FG379_002179 [Cryptosporidium bovis]
MVDGESYLKLDEMSKSTVEQEDPIKIGLRKRIREIKSMKDIKELDDLGEIYYKNDNLMSEPEIKFDIDNYTIKEYLEEGENFYPLLECLLEEESQNTSFPLIQ